MDARARYDADTTLFRLYVSFRDVNCVYRTFTSFTRSKREIFRINSVKSRADQEFRKFAEQQFFFVDQNLPFFFDRKFQFQSDVGRLR